MFRYHQLPSVLCAVVVAALLAGLVGPAAPVATAAPPHPRLLESGSGAVGKPVPGVTLPDLDEWHSRGIDTPSDFFITHLKSRDAARSPQAPTPFRILTLLVDFDDHTSQVNPTFFDSLVYSAAGATIRDYFDEVSYSQIEITTINLPSSIGWSRAPQDYSYYVGSSNGTGSYPNNSQRLVEDVCALVDSVVDFSDYDNDSDGDVDVLLVVHSGTGAEYSGSGSDIWSHKWSVSGVSHDGVSIRDYTVQPEFWGSPGDMTIGVYSHELCHGFGLPDLYDTDSTASFGAGRWCIMATGSWNGPGGLGGSPSHPSAWCRINMGFAAAANVTGNTIGQSITPVENGGTIFRLWNAGAASNEYFLVENRQKTGYDSYLPSEGLLIWHIDDAKSSNRQEWYPGMTNAEHYLVALEQADGLWELEHKNDYGDGGDPFPGLTSATSFSGSTSPNSNGYLSGSSFVAVENISPSGSNVTADLIVGLAAGIDDDDPPALPTTIDLAQNYPNPFNPTTTIEFTVSQSATADLDIYNSLGQRVKTLLKDNVVNGTTSISWDATDDTGEQVASGVYLYRLVIDDRTESRKMMLVQ